MATEAQWIEALRRADAAGNVDDARAIAARIKALRAERGANNAVSNLAAPTTPAVIPGPRETGLPDFVEGDTVVPRAPFDPTNPAAGYDTEFVKNGQRYNYNFTNGDPYRDPSKRYIGDEGPLGNALQAVLFGIRGAVEGAGKLAIDTPLELINQAPRMLDAVTQAGTYPIREIMRALGFEPPEHEVPESISGMVARTMGTPDRGVALFSDVIEPGIRTGTEALKSAVTGSDFDPRRIEPSGPVGRIAERIGNEIGAAGLPIFGALRGANALKLAGRTGMGPTLATEGMNPIARPFVESALADPANFARKELAAAAAAGTGAGLAGEITDNPYADLAGSLLGVGTYSIGSGVGGRLRDIFSALTGNSEYTSQLVRENVVDTILRNSTTAAGQVDPADPFRPVDTRELVRAIQQRPEVEDVVPGFSASTAERAKDPGLMGLETARARAGGPTASLFDERRFNNIDAVEAAVGGLAPDEAAGAFRAALGLERGTQLTAAQEAALAARNAAADRTAALTPSSQQADRGNTLRTQIEMAHEAAKARTRAAYDQVGQDVQVDPVDLSGVIDNAVAGLTETERSLLPEGLLARVQRLGRPVDPVIPQALRDDIEQTTDEIASEISRYTKRDVKPFDIDAWLAETDPQGGLIFEGGSKQGRRDIADESLSAEWRMAFEHSKKDGNLKFLYDRLATLRGEEQRAMGSTSAPPISLEEAKTLRSELGRRISAALADPKAESGGRVAARALSRVERALDDFIAGSLTPEQQAAEMAARAAKTAEASAFGRQGDPVADAIATRPGGEYRKTDANVAKDFRDGQKMDTLLSRVDTPEVRTALREEILAQNTGSDARAVERFMASYGDRFDRFPGLRDEVEGLLGARRTSEAAASSEETLRRVLGDENRRGTGDVAKWLEHGDARAQDAMQDVIASADPKKTMAGLLDFVRRTPRAVEGAKKAFWELLERKGKGGGLSGGNREGEDTWLPNKARKWLNDRGTRAAAEELYRDDPEQLGRLDKIFATLRDVSAERARSKAQNPSGTQQARRGQAVTLAEAQAKGYEVVRGRVNLLYAATYLASRFANRVVARQSEAAFGRLLDRALTDPEVATALLREDNPANRAILARGAKAWLGNQYGTVVEAWFNDEDDEGDPVVAAALRDTDAKGKVAP